MAKVKLAELLLRRKECQMKVTQLHQINVPSLFETKVKRMNVNESTDDITATVPKITADQVSQAYDWWARKMRQVDALIQQANWATDVECGQEDLMADYQPPAPVTSSAPAPTS